MTPTLKNVLRKAMKLYIVEGPDNSGKSTLAESIKDFYVRNDGVADGRILIDHFGVPEGRNDKEKADNADKSYKSYIKNLKNMSVLYDVIILDRAWYGEYVYGPLYRNRAKDDVALMIRNVEDMLMNILDDDDIKLIITTTDNIKFLVDHEDGHSLSKADADKIFDEVQDFVEIADKVSALKNIEVLNVNEYGTLVFRDKKELCSKALL